MAPILLQKAIRLKAPYSYAKIRAYVTGKPYNKFIFSVGNQFIFNAGRGSDDVPGETYPGYGSR
jgi:hypothetical protein